ncbi:hypothetical protein P3T76_000810 [Phytophthora citrophthora]|uniref:Uncharacterized protein n=1 Tax=Phytophthora citrophthora TaxID=4793 RepID=A0AAD9H1M6_9STRA|nr:hypothetical protein P3T76_000810 [Phytophthora citrophthora]
MSFSTLRRRRNRETIKEESAQSVDERDDSCPLLGDDDRPSSIVKPQRIRNVHVIDNGLVTPKRSFTQRIMGRKNRLIQRVLVACRLTEPSKDSTFKQVQMKIRTKIEQLTAIRTSLHDHSQSIVKLSTAIYCFADSLQDGPTNIARQIRDVALTFSDQVGESILAKIDLRVNEFERIDALIQSRAKLVLDVEYAKRTLAIEHQKGNVNRIAERKQALQTAQLECEKATRFITDHLKFLSPNQATDVLKLCQEVRSINSFTVEIAGTETQT